MKDDDFRFTPKDDSFPEFNLDELLGNETEEYEDSRLKDAGLDEYQGDIRDYDDLSDLYEEDESFFTRLTNLEPKALIILASVFGAIFLAIMIILLSVTGKNKNKTPNANELINNGTVQTSPGTNAAGVSPSMSPNPSASPVASPFGSPAVSPTPTSGRTPPPVNYTPRPTATPTPRPNLVPVVTPTPYVYTTPTPTPYLWVPASKTSINYCTFAPIQDVIYNGTEQWPAPVITYGTTTLLKGSDYDLAYSNAINAGTATITVTGRGNYKDTKYVYFRIVPKDISTLDYSTLSDVTYTGAEQKQKPIVAFGARTLTENVDYTLTYSDAVNQGRVTVTVTGIGNYKGTKTLYYNINAAPATPTPTPAPVNLTQVTAELPANTTYNGGVQKQPFTLSYNGARLLEGTDYDAVYSDAINAGTVTIKITGKGSYTGEKTLSYTIDRANVKVKANDASKTAGEADPDFTATVQVISDIPMAASTEGIVKYSISCNHSDVEGYYDIIVTGDAVQGNYNVTYEGGTLTVNAKPTTSIADLYCQPIGDITYDGAEHRPEPAIWNGDTQLVKDVDYTLEYYGDLVNVSATTEAGYVTIGASGIGNYCETLWINFSIVPKSLNGMFVAPPNDAYYDGTEQRHGVAVSDGDTFLEEGKDYVLNYSYDLVNPGTVDINITFIGNYSGETWTSYQIIAPEPEVTPEPIPEPIPEPTPEETEQPEETTAPEIPQDYTPENLHNKAYPLGAVTGINVSQAQENIDWYTVKNDAAIDYAMIRVGYRDANGNYTLDDQFEQNITNAYNNGNGIKVGVYFELDVSNTWDVASAAQQVATWLDSHRYDIAYPIAISFVNEPSDSTMDSTARTKLANDFFGKMKELYPECKTALFVTRDDLNNNKFNTWELGESKIWLSDFADTNDYSGSAMAQVSGNGVIPGINNGSKVGMNIGFESYYEPERPSEPVSEDGGENYEEQSFVG